MKTRNKIARRPRIHAKIRQAIEYHIRHVMTPQQACEAAGISFDTWSDAIERPHIQSIMIAERSALLAEHDSMAKLQPAQARRVLSDIMNDDEVPPAIRVRAAGIVMREDARREKSDAQPVATQELDPPYVYSRPDDLDE